MAAAEIKKATPRGSPIQFGKLSMIHSLNYEHIINANLCYINYEKNKIFELTNYYIKPS